MNYDFSRKYSIKITGTSDEIRDWLKEISDFMDKGSSYSLLKEYVDNLESIVEPVKYTFGLAHRISFNCKSLIYTPNVTGEAAEKLHFVMFKKMFNEAKKKMDQKYNK